MLYFLSGCIFLGWLIPNHYFPWLSAWNEAISIVGLLLLSLYSLHTHRTPPQASMLLVAFFGLIFTLPWLQLAAGHLFFAGDAVMVSLYAACALLAICLGHALCCSPAQHAYQGFTALMTASTLAAIASTGIALVQWTGALSLGIYGADPPPAVALSAMWPNLTI